MILEREPRRREAVEALRDDLLALAPGERLDRRFHSQDLVDLLLEESRAALLTDPEGAGIRAGFALDLAQVLRDTRFLASDAVARAGRLKADALRLSGDLEGARGAFSEARRHLGAESAERPFFCRSLGLLRWEQNRLEEAAALFQHAARLFQPNEAEEGASLLLGGLLCSETSIPAHGLPPLIRGWNRARPRRHPWLSLCCGFALATLLVDDGESLQGSAVFTETMDLYPLVRKESQTLHAMRLEGAARARLGEIGQAEELLEAVRQRQLARLDLLGVALTSLELAVVQTGLGKPEGIGRLIGDIAGKFEPEEGGTFAVEALAMQAGMRQGEKARHSTAKAAAELRQLCRMFEIPLEPIPFA